MREHADTASKEQATLVIHTHGRACTHTKSHCISRLQEEAKSPGAEAHSTDELTAQLVFRSVGLGLGNNGMWEPGPQSDRPPGL